MNITNAPLYVIFGTGPVGRAVMWELVAKGKRVRSYHTYVQDIGKALMILGERDEALG